MHNMEKAPKIILDNNGEQRDIIFELFEPGTMHLREGAIENFARNPEEYDKDSLEYRKQIEAHLRICKPGQTIEKVSCSEKFDEYSKQVDLPFEAENE